MNIVGSSLLILLLLFTGFVIYSALMFPFNNIHKVNQYPLEERKCNLDSDCAVVSRGGACSFHQTCVNKEILNEIDISNNLVSALSIDCSRWNVVACKCQDNICENIDYLIPEALSDCDYVSDSVQKDECYKVYAINNIYLESCFQINNTDKKSECIFEIGVIKNDTEICYGLIDNLSRDKCLSTIAQNLRDITICQYTSSLEKCQEIFYEEHCDLLGEDIDSENLDYDKYFILKTPYKCRDDIEISEKYPVDGGYIFKDKGTIKVDSNGISLIKKSEILLNRSYFVADKYPPVSHQGFRIDSYEVKEVEVIREVCNDDGSCRFFA